MTSWTPARSILLSQLLDDVNGTEEMVHIRQDYCKIDDFLQSTAFNTNIYYTGSKAEGLDLPGSDDDFMYDIRQKRSTEGCSKFKSPETRQVQERLVSTLEHKQVPKWDRTRCP